MEGALAWIGKIAEWIGQWFPRWTVLDRTQGAVKSEGFFLPTRLRRFKDDVRVTALAPGLHWWWPATTAFELYPTSFQTDNLPSQTMETNDDTTITVGGMITYTVVDIEKLLTQTHSGQKMIQAKTLAAIHKVCCKMTWDQLKKEQREGTLDTKLRNACQRPLTMFGVKVEDCQLTDLAKTRVYRLIQSTQQDNE